MIGPKTRPRMVVTVLAGAALWALAGLFSASAVAASAAAALASLVPAASQAVSFPSLAEIEAELFRVLNADRAARGQAALRLSPRLSGLARDHSSEMARREVLAHESADGKSFSGRLVDAAVLFASNGENVARSGTYAAKLIHESFMASPGHRENILNPLFDEVGIGIAAGPENTYYVTEDFIRALVEKPAAEVQAFVLGVLNEARAASGRPPIVRLEQADRAAQQTAEAKAAGHPLPSVPGFFGETLVRVASGPDLNMVAGRIRGPELAGYGRAGIGILFGRSPEFPGGAYFVCVLLIRDSAASGADDLDRLLTVLAAANAIRAEKKLPALELDAGLSERADAVIARKRGGETGEGPEEAARDIHFAMFQKLDHVRPELRKRLEDPGVRRIGISILPIQTSDGVPLMYAVAVVLGR